MSGKSLIRNLWFYSSLLLHCAQLFPPEYFFFQQCCDIHSALLYILRLDNVAVQCFVNFIYIWIFTLHAKYLCIRRLSRTAPHPILFQMFISVLCRKKGNPNVVSYRTRIVKYSSNAIKKKTFRDLLRFCDCGRLSWSYYYYSVMPKIGLDPPPPQYF